MPQRFIRVTSRPAGEAPDAIRDNWIGLVLPVLHEAIGSPADLTEAPRVGRPGYEVRWSDAMRILGAKHPEARDWWKQNVQAPTTVIFEESCCRLATDFEL